MRENKLKKYLTQDEKEEMYSQMHLFREDMVFLKVLIKRSKSSMFDFDIIPRTNMCTKFIRDLFMQYYYFGNMDDGADIFITEFEVVKKMFHIIDNEEINDDVIEMVKEVYTYFKSNFEIDIIKYIGDFIGCSLGCTGVNRIISKIVTENKL